MSTNAIYFLPILFTFLFVALVLSDLSFPWFTLQFSRMKHRSPTENKYPFREHQQLRMSCVYCGYY